MSTSPKKSAEVDIAKILEEIKKSTKVFSVPADFDPLTASPDQLEAFGLRAIPDPDLDPQGYAFWTRLYSPPLTWETTAFSIAPQAMSLLDHRAQLAPLAGHDERSANWSGCYITPRDSQMLVEIRGSWQAPVVAPPTAGEIGEFHSSTWIGLDGQRRYLNSSLPQIGTAQYVDVTATGTTFTTKAWWQWWLRDHFNPPIDLPLTINPQDIVSCSIVAVSPTHARFYLKNESTGVMQDPYEAVHPSPSASLPVGSVQAQISGATAEWVMERPREPTTGKLYRLPSYGTVEFNDCQAVSSPAPGSATQVPRDLQGSRRITMYEVREGPHRTKNVSAARRPLGPHRTLTVFVPG